MKKIVPVIIFTLMISLFTAGCGSTAQTEAKTDEPSAEVTEASEGTADAGNAAAISEETAAPQEEASSEPAESDVDARAIAESMIDGEVSDLIEIIGEPNDSDYGPSCLGPGEDGELIYDNFTVYTYKEGDSEVIIDVDD